MSRWDVAGSLQSRPKGVVNSREVRKGYEPGSQGFAAMKARKQAEDEALMVQFKEAALNGGIVEPILG